MFPKAFKDDDNEDVAVDSTNESIVNSSKNNKSRNSTHVPSIKALKEPIFLILNAKNVFSQ